MTRMLTRRRDFSIKSTKPRVLYRGSAIMMSQHNGTDVQEMLLESMNGLYSYALILTRERVEAEDLVQETCLRAIQAMERLRTDSNLKGWLFTIQRNIWFNQLRKLRNGPPMVRIEVDDGVADSIEEPSKDLYDLYISKVEAEQVRAAIQELPTGFREIILLREFEELSYQEIAGVVNCPVGTVMSRLGRARAKLRMVLAATLRPSIRSSESGEPLP